MQKDDTAQKLAEFMGEMRASSHHRGEMLDKLEEQLEILSRKQEQTNRKVDELSTKITRWESKLGAFLFLASCLWAFFMAMKNEILTFFRG